ncbi:MAG: argininosuccinate lyase, partial [Acidimicrobiales bacterium]
MSTLWHGRFEGGPAEELLAFTVSLPFDRRLAGDDLTGSRAHVRGLVRAGVLTIAEADEVLGALDQVEQELLDGDLAFLPSDEDIHTVVERRVTELAGAAGAKLHTGRSRNDQVATDLRLFTKREIVAVAGRVLVLQQVLLELAEAAGEAYLPGYTHLQRAQPVLLAHHLLAHAWALSRDVDRLLDTHRRLDVSPLGAGALAGSSLALDPEGVAADLGFAAAFENSLDAVSDRDFVAEALFDLTMVGLHLSRIGEEVVLWSTEEFGFLKLADGYSTGSSMLPQKKNPDIAELARGKSGRLIGHLTGLLATLKALPLAYNRDLQEDKEPLFDALDQVTLALAAMSGLLASSTFVTEVMAAAADSPTAAATDLAEYLVDRGMPFRDAHGVVGALVRRSLAGDAARVDLVA